MDAELVIGIVLGVIAALVAAFLFGRALKNTADQRGSPTEAEDYRNDPKRPRDYMDDFGIW